MDKYLNHQMHRSTAQISLKIDQLMNDFFLNEKVIKHQQCIEKKILKFHNCVTKHI